MRLFDNSRWGRNQRLVKPIDWPKKCAEAEVRLAFALGFLRTIPSDNTSAEEGEAWRGRLNRFLAQSDGSQEGRTDG